MLVNRCSYREDERIWMNEKFQFMALFFIRFGIFSNCKDIIRTKKELNRKWFYVQKGNVARQNEGFSDFAIKQRKEVKRSFNFHFYSIEFDLKTVFSVYLILNDRSFKLTVYFQNIPSYKLLFGQFKHLIYKNK